MSREELKFMVGNSSAKSFAMHKNWVDVVLSLIFSIAAAGLAYACGDETIVSQRAVLAFLAAISVYSSFVIVRVLVPFVLHLSFAQMMRLRLPFYIWTVSLIIVAGLCGASKLFSTISFSSIQLTLILASIMLIVRFFQNGSLLRLALAFSCAGGAVGFSMLGILALVLVIFLMWSMSIQILVAPNFTSWKDEPHPKVVEYFTNPLVRSRLKWIFAGCFLLCGGLAFRIVMREAGGMTNAGHVWLSGIGLDGAAFLLVTAILPLVIGLSKAGVTSDVIEHCDAYELIVYIVIAPLTALFMLKPHLIPSLAELNLHIEPNMLAIASVIYVFNLLLAGMIILVDIRCRDFRGVNGVSSNNLRNVMRFSYTMVCIAPLIMFGYAVFLNLR